MNRIDSHSLGLAFARFLAFCAVAWSVLVWLGAAQGVIDFLFRLQMITTPFQLVSFSFSAAAALVSVAICFGYLAGLLMGLILNHGVLGRSRTQPAPPSKSSQLPTVRSIDVRPRFPTAEALHSRRTGQRSNE